MVQVYDNIQFQLNELLKDITADDLQTISSSCKLAIRLQSQMEMLHLMLWELTKFMTGLSWVVIFGALGNVLLMIFFAFDLGILH